MTDTREVQIKKQLRALVTAIRPSIVWMIDGVTQPMDLLDDDGITGWQVGLSSISAQIRESPDSVDCWLTNWIAREQELEMVRWKNPRLVLGHARMVLGSDAWQLSRDQVLLDQWLHNINAALSRSPVAHRTPQLATKRYATHLVCMLRYEEAAREVRDRLKSIAELPHSGLQETLAAPHLEATSGQHQPRLVDRRDLQMLNQWLGAAPRVKSTKDTGTKDTQKAAV